EEEDSKAHEELGHQEDEELFENITRVLGRGELINKEPGYEEHANGQKYNGQ
ncbi:NEDD4-binding 2-like 2, partial [Sigmodon hispidus]